MTTIQQFVSSFGLTYPILRDETASVYFSYRVSGLSPFPQDCIIDQSGIIQYLRSEYDPQFMLQVVNQLLLTEIDDNKSTKAIPSTLNLGVYPNPTNSQVTIEFSILDPGDINLTLFDTMGRQILARQLAQGKFGEKRNYHLDLESQASGVYFVSVRNGRFREIRKLLLSR